MDVDELIGVLDMVKGAKQKQRSGLRPLTKQVRTEKAGPALRSGRIVGEISQPQEPEPEPTTLNGEIDVMMRAQKLKEFSQTAKGQFAAVFQSLTHLPTERIFANALGFNVPVQSSHLMYVREERNLERPLSEDVEEDEGDANKTREAVESELHDFPSDSNTTVQRKSQGRTVQLRRDDESVYLRKLRDQVTPYLAPSETVTFTAEVLGAIITATNLMGTAIFASVEFKTAINGLGHEAVIFNDLNPPLFITLFAQLAGWSYLFSQHVAPKVRTFKDQETKILPLMRLTLDQINTNFRFDGEHFRQKLEPNEQSISNVNDPFFRGLLQIGEIHHSEV